MVIEALSAISTAMDIGKRARELSKRLDSMELREILADQQDALLDVREENQRLRDETVELRAKLELKTSMVFLHGRYWMGEDPAPYCRLCYEKDNKYLHLEPMNGGHWCSVCRTSYDPVD